MLYDIDLRPGYPFEKMVVKSTLIFHLISHAFPVNVAIYVIVFILVIYDAICIYQVGGQNVR